jgi:hypothetical protein
MANFQARVHNGTLFRTGLHKIMPGASARAVQRFFDGRADLRAIAKWKAGKEWPADWAAEKIRAHIAREIAELETIAAQLRSGPGRKGHRATLKQFRQAA